MQKEKIKSVNGKEFDGKKMRTIKNPEARAAGRRERRL